MNHTATGSDGVLSNAIMSRLKQATQDCHARLESLPYFQALMAHTLPLECYVDQLAALSVIHGVFEKEIAIVTDARVARIWESGLEKLPLLKADLAFFEPRSRLNHTAAIDAALDLTRNIRLRRIEMPLSLLGYLYVLEGSTLGNHMHRPDISATFRLDGFDGCSYYASYREEVPRRWKYFSEKMNAALTDAALHDPIIEAALETFAGLEKVYSALFPLRPKSIRTHATRFNPEAGNHPMPEDEREIQAALSASQRAWDMYAYYDVRYGERGRRFSDSDACWLTTLTHLDDASMHDQVEWIARVLASRGMPIIMLEQTLRQLHGALCEAVPDRADAYAKLQRSSDLLRKARETRLSAADGAALVAEFEHKVGPELSSKYHGSGELLVAAVADEANGFTGSSENLRQWMTDPARFSQKWIAAVDALLEEAKKRASEPQ